MANVTEKVCPDCAETVKGEARVCRFCGYRFDGAATDAQAPAAPPAISTVAHQAASFGGREWFVVWACGSALLMLVGAFGPWVKALGRSTSQAQMAGTTVGLS